MTAAPAATQQQQHLNNQALAQHFTKDLKEAYDLHLKNQSQAAATVTTNQHAGGLTALNGLNLPPSSQPVSNITAQLPQPNNGVVPTQRTDEDRAAGTALLGFLSSLRQSYEDALRGQQQQRGGLGAGAAPAPVEPGKSDSSDENRAAATVTDSNAGSNPPDSSVEDSDWNSDKKTDPSSSEDSDKETPGKTKGQRSSGKRQKLATTSHEV